MISSSFNKKKWLQNHLVKILELKSQSLTLQAIIKHLKTSENMPFDLTESLLSRYLKEFSNEETSTLQTQTALKNKIERQRNRLERQNNEIQNLSKRLNRVLERNQLLLGESREIKERNQILENKFLEGEARLKDLRRYNGYNNVHWKVAELEQKNDDLFQATLRLERLSERLAEPHEEADEKIKQLENKISIQYEEKQKLELQLSQMEDLILHHDQEKIEQLESKISILCKEKQALKLQLSQINIPIFHQNQKKITELTQEKQELIHERSELSMYVKRLKSALSHSDHNREEIRNHLLSIQYNVKWHDRWRNSTIALGIISIVLSFILVFI